MPDVVGHHVGSDAILGVTHRIHEMQVRGIDAQRIMTAMIALQAVGDRAVEYSP